MNENNDVVLVTFGKYNGKPLAAVPSDYIAWALKESSILEKPDNRDLKMSLEDELVRRLINIPVSDRSQPINTFVTSYDKHEKILILVKRNFNVLSLINYMIS